MICLAIDVSGRALSGAIGARESASPRILGEFCLDTGKNHSLALLPMTEALLRNCHLKLADVDVAQAAGGFVDVIFAAPAWNPAWRP